MSPEAKRLRKAARALLPELLRDHPRGALALTGSAARGDASAGSDLDLWCVGPGQARHVRQHFVRDGVPVTLLLDGPRSARTAQSFARCEVEDLVALYDPRGVFAALKREARARAPLTWRHLCRVTSLALVEELSEAARGPVWNRLPPLREAALRFAAAWAYRHHGWRTPRWRTLQPALPPDARRHLASILCLPSAPSARRALARTRRALAAQRLGPLPREVDARVAAGEWDEAVLLARRHLEREVVPGLRRMPPTLADAIRALHRVAARDTLVQVYLAAHQLLHLCVELAVLDWFSPEVKVRLFALQGF